MTAEYNARIADLESSLILAQRETQEQRQLVELLQGRLQAAESALLPQMEIVRRVVAYLKSYAEGLADNGDAMELASKTVLTVASIVSDFAGL